nr:MAG: hypothetical protein 1 [Leviviridae sp.]
MGSMKVKTRSWYSGAVSGGQRGSGFVPFRLYSSAGLSSSETVHTMSHARRGNGWSGGGPFKVLRTLHAFSPETVNSLAYAQNGTTVLAYGTNRIGGPTTSGAEAPTQSILTDDQLYALGTTAIARTEPLNPAFDTSVALGEVLREGVPSIPGEHLRDRVALARSSGKEYLNVEFGWAPLVRSVKDFARVVENSDRILRAHQEQKNRFVQVAYHWPSVEDSKAFASSFTDYAAAGFFTGGGRYTHSFKKTWFECEYMYYSPTGGTHSGNSRQFGANARKLLGARLDPEVLWNLAPWSWAADWFSNTGDVLHNLSALGTGSLLLRHGYIMCHVRKEVQDTGSYKGQRQTHLQVVETKRRLHATPFGFGVDFASLSPKQIAITAALGLSRW